MLRKTFSLLLLCSSAIIFAADDSNSSMNDINQFKQAAAISAYLGAKANEQLFGLGLPNATFTDFLDKEPVAQATQLAPMPGVPYKATWTYSGFFLSVANDKKTVSYSLKSPWGTSSILSAPVSYNEDGTEQDGTFEKTIIDGLALNAFPNASSGQYACTPLSLCDGNIYPINQLLGNASNQPEKVTSANAYEGPYKDGAAYLQAYNRLKLQVPSSKKDTVESKEDSAQIVRSQSASGKNKKTVDASPKPSPKTSPKASPKSVKKDSETQSSGWFSLPTCVVQ